MNFEVPFSNSWTSSLWISNFLGKKRTNYDFCIDQDIIWLCLPLEHVTLLFVGDVSFAGPVKYYVEHNYHTYEDSFSEVAEYIKDADISVANLECPFVDKKVYRHMFKDKRRLTILYSSPEAAPALR